MTCISLLLTPALEDRTTLSRTLSNIRPPKRSKNATCFQTCYPAWHRAIVLRGGLGGQLSDYSNFCGELALIGEAADRTELTGPPSISQLGKVRKTPKDRAAPRLLPTPHPPCESPVADRRPATIRTSDLIRGVKLDGRNPGTRSRSDRARTQTGPHKEIRRRDTRALDHCESWPSLTSCYPSAWE